MRLSRKTIDVLVKNNWTISTAESCTGGLLAHTITNTSGSSNYFAYGYITYSDEAKIQELNIAKEIIEKHSSYSGEVAELMAKNIREKTNSTIGLSTTGIAPPGDPNSLLPAGTVFISFSTSEKTIHFKFQVKKKTRIQFKKQVVKYVIKILSDQISTK